MYRQCQITLEIYENVPYNMITFEIIPTLEFPSCLDPWLTRMAQGVVRKNVCTYDRVEQGRLQRRQMDPLFVTCHTITFCLGFKPDY